MNGDCLTKKQNNGNHMTRSNMIIIKEIITKGQVVKKTFVQNKVFYFELSGVFPTIIMHSALLHSSHKVNESYMMDKAMQNMNFVYLICSLV